MQVKHSRPRRPRTPVHGRHGCTGPQEIQKHGVTPATAKRHAERFHTIVSNCSVHAADGVMDLGEGPRNTTVRRFDDHSLLAEPEGETPKALTIIRDKDQAEEILNTGLMTDWHTNDPTAPNGSSRKQQRQAASTEQPKNLGRLNRRIP